MKKQNWFITIPVVLMGVFWVFSMVYNAKSRTLKEMKPYVDAMKMVKDNEALVVHLGEPIEDGFLPEGTFSVNGDNGVANLTIQLSGPNNSGELWIDATRQNALWKYNNLIFRDQSGKEFNLLQ